MKSLSFQKLLVMAPLEKVAKRIKFDPKTTILEGPNHVGKSSLIKTLFAAFGAPPTKVSDRWRQANIQALVHFEANAKRYSILHSGRTRVLFDGDGNVILRSTNVMRDLAPVLAEILNFKLQLSMRDGSPSIASPSALFAPYYIDQDTGWNDRLNSFSDLAMFKDPKKDLIDYHVGVRPNEFYIGRTRVRTLQKEREEPVAKEQALRSIQTDLVRRLEDVSFEIDLKEFTDVIERLLKRVESMKRAEDAYRARIVSLRNRREDLQAQRAVVSAGLREVSADYEFAATGLADEVECPTCRTVHVNDILHRFGLATDISQCEQMLNEVDAQLADIDAEIEQEQAKLAQSDGERKVVEQLLAEKKGAVTLKELIENEGKRGFRKALDADLDRVAAKIGGIDAEVRSVEDEISKFDDRKRRTATLDRYRDELELMAHRLKVEELPKSAFRKLVGPSRSLTGSGSPRAVLAYHIAILRVISEGPTGLLAPIVFDAINQQEQDDENLRLMLKAIRDDVPEGVQRIVGLVDRKGVEFDGDIIPLTHKHHVLQKGDFAVVNEAMRPFLEHLAGSATGARARAYPKS